METGKNNLQERVKFTDPVICYPGHIEKCSHISKTARNILDIILIIMRIDNHIYFDYDTISLMRRIAKQYHGKEFAVQTIRNVINELFKSQIILRYNKKNYFINPTYFMKFAPDERRKNLQKDFYKMGLLKAD